MNRIWRSKRPNRAGDKAAGRRPALRLERLSTRLRLAILELVALALAVSTYPSGIWVNRLRRRRGEEGSIGEWVMILVMAVGITLFIWSIAQPMLGSILRRALGKLFR